MNEYKRMIKKSKEKDWHEFVRRESASDSWGTVYKICMGKNRRDGLASLRTAAGFTRTWHDSASVLMHEFFPTDEGAPIPPDMPPLYSGVASALPPGEGNIDNSAREFSMDEFEYAISRMRMGKSPGIDGITNGMVLQVALAIPSFMKAMYDSCLKEGLFPKPWKAARVVALLKGAEKDKAEPRSYRPISLLSGLGKILERMMVRRLQRRMTGRWNQRQYGFRENKCTEDAWTKAIELVGASDRKHVIGVFVDFKGAFDYLLWQVILAKLRQVGSNEAELVVWHDYFRNRWAFLIGEHDEVVRRVERGCPQGSVAGPILWNLCMNDLLNDLSNMHVEVVAFADDLLLLIEGETRRLVESRAGEVMEHVYARYSSKFFNCDGFQNTKKEIVKCEKSPLLVQYHS